MTAKAAICQALLKGEVLTIRTAFADFGVTNLPREMTRLIERQFGCLVSRVRRTGKTRYGVPSYWYEYRLNKTLPVNQEPIKKMQAYVLRETLRKPKWKPGSDPNQAKLF